MSDTSVKRPMLQLPSQRVSDKEKESENWYTPTVDWYIDKALSITDQDRRVNLLNAANGIIDTTSLQYALTPYGKYSSSQRGTKYKLPGELRDTGLIKDIVLKYMGRWLLLPSTFIVTIEDEDILMKVNEEVANEVGKYLQQALVNLLNQNGMDTGSESKPLSDIKEYTEKLRTEFFNNKVVEAQKLLDAIRDWTNDRLRYIDAYYSFIVLGEYYSYRTIYNKTFHKEICNTLECFPVPNNELFVEDYDCFLRRYMLSVDQVYDYFWDDLSKKDKEYLDHIRNTDVSDATKSTQMVDYLASRLVGYMTSIGETGTDHYGKYTSSTSSGIISGAEKGLVYIYHIVFPTQRKIGILKYLGAVGLAEKEVDDNYEFNPENGDISIEWDYISCSMEAIRIGDQYTGIYFKPKYLISDRGLLNNKFKNKIPYGGKRGLLNYKFDHSIPSRLLEYELMSRLYRYAVERELQRGLLNGTMHFIPKSVLQSEERTEQDNLYFLASDGRIIYDDTDVAKWQAVVQGVKVIDPKANSFIATCIELDKKNIEDAYNAIGWNRQMDGQSFASDGKAVTEQMLTQAAFSTILITDVFNQSRAQDYTADIEIAKLLLLDKEYDINNGSYIDNDGNVKYLNVNSDNLYTSKLKVRVTNAEEVQKRLRQFQEMAFNLSQNGDSDLAVAAINSTNPKEIEEKITKWKKMMREREDQVNQIKREEIAATQKAVEREISSKEYIAELKEEGSNYREELKLSAGANDSDAVSKHASEVTKRMIDERRLANEERRTAAVEEGNRIKREGIKSTERIAKNKENKK